MTKIQLGLPGLNDTRWRKCGRMPIVCWRSSNEWNLKHWFLGTKSTTYWPVRKTKRDPRQFAIWRGFHQLVFKRVFQLKKNKHSDSKKNEYRTGRYSYTQYTTRTHTVVVGDGIRSSINLERMDIRSNPYGFKNARFSNLLALLSIFCMYPELQSAWKTGVTWA